MKARVGMERTVRRGGIAIAGFSVLVCGLALLVVPVPGTSLVVFPIGLAILAKEFDWARRLLAWSRGVLRRLWSHVTRAFHAALAASP
jgi:uncharacterized protein (TIGR02611 family)